MNRFGVVRIAGIGLALAGIICGFFFDFSNMNFRPILSSSNCTKMLLVGLLLNSLGEVSQLRSKHNDKSSLLSKRQLGIGVIVALLIFGGSIWFAS